MKYHGASGPWIPSESTKEVSLLTCYHPRRGGGQSVPGLEEAWLQDLVVVKMNQGPTASPTYGTHLYIWVKALLTPLFPITLCIEEQLIGAWLYLAWCQEPRTSTIQVCVAVKRRSGEKS